MRYISKTLVCGALSMLALLGTTSCGEDFLKEDAGHLYTDALLEDETGALQMAAGLYANLRWHFGYEWAYGITIYGCDEFTNGADLTSEPWNTYDSRLNPLDCTPALGAANKNCPAVSALWDEMYYGISTANLVISKAVKVQNEDSRNKALGEAYFLRGYNYYRLFCQYGGVVLQLEPADGTVKKNYTRATEDEVLTQIISDLENAYKMLPKNKWRGNGTWTRYTAYDKNADLSRAISLCDEVIQACPLASDYWALYAKWTGVDCKNEGLSEILMAAEHNADATTQGRFGNRTYNYFDPQFSNFSGGWVQRGQYIGGMDFQRCRPTEYTYSVFDNVNDARMWKTFKTVYGLNHAAATREKAVADNGIKAEQMPAIGDEGIIFILNNKNDKRDLEANYGTFGRGGVAHSFVNPLTGKWVPNAFPAFLKGTYVMYNYGVSGNTATSNVFCGINKTADGTRTAEKGDAHRDVIMARSGETYLVKAECQVRLGDYQGAISTINVLRARGQWKKDEDRSYYTDGSMAFLKADGGDNDNSTATATSVKKNKDFAGNTLTNTQAYYASMTHKNTYYLSTGIAETTEPSDLQIKSYTKLPEEDEAILKTIGATSDYDRMLNFVFNERTRELLGEWDRWDELARAGLLITRAKAFNPEARANITANKHEYRPIPQKFIDTLQHEDGTNLSDAEKKAWQNPGY